MAKSEKNPKLDAYLKQMKKKWNAAKEESKKNQSGVNVEDGPYPGQLTNMEMGIGDKGPWVKAEFTVPEGDDAGEKITRFWGIETEEKLIWFQRDLRRMGVEVDDIEDPAELKEVIRKLVKEAPTVRLRVKTNGDYTNVYIDKLLDLETESAGDDDDDDDAEPDDDDDDEDSEDSDDDDEDADEDDDDDAEDDDDDSADEDNDDDDDAPAKKPKTAASGKGGGGKKKKPAAVEDDDDDDDADGEIVKGSKVSFIVDKKKLTGTVRRVKGNACQVKASNGKTYEADKDELDLVVEED